MKGVYLVPLLLTTAFFMMTSVPCAFAGEKEEDFWLDEEDFSGRGQMEMSSEFVERVLKNIQQSDPNKAVELRRLSDQDPNKFRTELRRVMREHYGRRRRVDRDPNDRSQRDREAPGGRGEQRGMSARMRQTYDEYLKWLEEAYPDEARKLAELKENKPELYGRNLGISFRRHYRVYEAARENPRLAEILREDARLKREREQLRRKMAAAETPGQKAQLAEELKDVVSRRFDLIIARKLIAYERLSSELKKLQKEVEQKGAEVEKWKDAQFKKENIEARLKDLLSEDKRFKWE